MKKYISLLVIAIIAILSSCSNEDITISKMVNFTVNPATVVSSFSSCEENPGELESFNTDCKLNVKLFVYDEDDNLVYKTSGQYSNYNVQLKGSTLLKTGKYTAVAITHIDDVTNNIYLWKIKGEEHLEGLQIVDQGYIGGQYKVLGVKVSEFEVKDGIADVSMNVQPAGTMVVVRYYDYDAYTSWGWQDFYLMGNKTNSYLEFDRSGKTNVITENENGVYKYIYDNIDASGFSSGYDYIYSYEYILPMSNVGLQFQVLFYDEWYTIGDPFMVNTEAGANYHAYVYISSFTTEFGKNNASRSVPNDNSGKGLYVPVKKFVRNGLTSGQILNVKDLK